MTTDIDPDQNCRPARAVTAILQMLGPWLPPSLWRAAATHTVRVAETYLYVPVYYPRITLSNLLHKFTVNAMDSSWISYLPSLLLEPERMAST